MATYLSPESGTETDGDRNAEELYIKAIVPDNLAYDSKAPIVIAFNKQIPRSRTYTVDFTGTRHRPMQITATATLLNECSLLVLAPVYYPPEDVDVNVYCGVQRKHLGNCHFRFKSRTEILAQLLIDSCDPVTFMCEALNLSPQDLEHLDASLSSAFMHNMPQGFDVLGAHRQNVAQETYAKYPTLLHFGAAFGLRNLVESLINSNCPGAPEAALLKNCDRMKPQELARYNGYKEIQERLLQFEAANEGDPYINMGSDDTYEPMSREGDASYVSMQYNDGGDYYTDMTSDRTADGDGYVTTDGRGNSDDGGYLSVVGHPGSDDPVQGIYEDMGPDSQPQEGELYEDMSQNHAAPAVPERGSSAIYDQPSNLPLSDYPLQRSASNSMEKPRNTPQRLAVPKHKSKSNSLSRESNFQDTEDPTNTAMIQNLIAKVQAGEMTRDQFFELCGPQGSSAPNREDPQCIRRSGSTSSRTSVLSTTSNTSNTSSTSSSSHGSVHESGRRGDEENNDGAIHMTQKELKERLEKKRIEAPPAPPPADYNGQDWDPGPLPVSVPPVSPRRPRPKTTPVNPSDIERARVQGAPPGLKRRDTAPPINPREEKPEKPRVPLSSEERRFSLPMQEAKPNKSRPPPPLPVTPGRPAAPPPVEERNPALPPPLEQRSTGVRGAVGPRPMSNMHGAVPTAFVRAMKGSPSQHRRTALDDKPAPPPPRSGQPPPLAPRVRPQPRH